MKIFIITSNDVIIYSKIKIFFQKNWNSRCLCSVTTCFCWRNLAGVEWCQATISKESMEQKKLSQSHSHTNLPMCPAHWNTYSRLLILPCLIINMRHQKWLGFWPRSPTDISHEHWCLFKKMSIFRDDTNKSSMWYFSCCHHSLLSLVVVVDTDTLAYYFMY